MVFGKKDVFVCIRFLHMNLLIYKCLCCLRSESFMGCPWYGRQAGLKSNVQFSFNMSYLWKGLGDHYSLIKSYGGGFEDPGVATAGSYNGFKVCH